MMMRCASFTATLYTTTSAMSPFQLSVPAWQPMAMSVQERSVPFVATEPAVPWSTYWSMEAERYIVLSTYGVLLPKAVAMVTPQEVVCDCIFTGRSEALAFGSVVMVTARLPEDGLWSELHASQAEWSAAGIESVKLAGDAFAPATIAHSVSAGRQYAEEFDVPPEALDVPFPREFPGIASGAFEPARAAATKHS